MKTIRSTVDQTKLVLGTLLLLLLALGFLLADTTPAQAATLTVPCTGNADNDGIALQTAVATANSNSQADTINLAANCTYQLPTALHFGSDGGRLLTVNGNGATIRGGRGAERHVLTVDGQAVATVDQVTLTGGIADGSGGSAGGLINYGDITLNRSTISGNIGTFDSALAIFIFYTNVAPFPTVTLNNSTVSGNTGTGSYGISSGGVLTFNNSTFANNASGIFILEGKFTANNSIVNDCSTFTTPRGVYAISHSLVEGGNCPVSNGVNGNIVGQSAGLLPLTGGGPLGAAYHPLPPGSPALNGGDNALVPAGATTDQAGNPRLFGTVDMGSVEYQGQPRAVTVTTNGASLAEGEAATLTFARTAPLNDALEIVFTVSGTAGSADRELRDANGQLVTNRMTIPAGSASATLTLSAVDDLVAEADETIVVTLSDTTTYNPGSPNAATVTIAANDYLVTRLTDYSGAATPATQEGTLRRAIENANHSATADTITFQGVNGTIALVGGTLTIANQGALTIEAAGITLNGNNAVMPVLINSGATAVLNDITITGGKSSNAGEAGAIYNNGTLTLNNALITGNRTDTGIGDGYAGGLYNNGTLTLNRSVVSNNFAKTAGGGIGNGGTLTLNSSSIINNESTGRGAGISGGFLGSITLINSTVSANRVTGATDPISGGGGIFNGSQLTLINSTVSNNTSIISAGGILNQGSMTLRNAIVANSSGGDCVNSGTRTVTNSLIEDGSCGITAGVSGNKSGDPMLAALTGNPVFHPLTAGSPAIDAGDNSFIPSGMTVDQSGNQRVFPTNGMVDMGSFEFGQMLVALTVDNTNVAEGGTALITISRVGNLSNPLTVGFVRSGTASSADYTLLQDNTPLTVDEVVIPAGAASVQTVFQAVDDVSAEAAETGVISLVDTNDYNLGAVSVATLTIPANDLVVTNLNDFTNTTPADARGGTLRQAILNANSFAGVDTITFAVTGVVELSAGSLRTQGSALTTIEGAGITVDGNGNGSVFRIEGPTTINDLTITGGNAARGSSNERGGGLLVSNLLTLNRSTVQGNQARLGGGIYNIFGTVTINNSTIHNNHATEYTGGIWNDEGLEPARVNMTINNSTISGNTAEHNAGIGLWGGKMVINQSAVVDNVDNQINLGQAGLVIQAPLEVNNSILANGLWYFGTLYGHDCYINGGTVTFRNSLIRRTWENCPLTNGVNGNIVGQEPGLGASTGNPAYYPLTADSPAINTGDNSLIPAGMTTDQAGNPRIVGGTVDMGPIEATTAPVDDDSDGVASPVEAGAPNNGDGNHDGIADNQQANVTSLPNAIDGAYVTLVAPAGVTFASVTAQTTSGTPTGATLVIGAVGFTLNGLTPGAMVDVTIFLANPPTFNGYYKLGVTADNPAEHWYAFPFDGATGAEILSDRILLHLVDGGRGDSDLAANGTIVDPGGPSFTPNTAPNVIATTLTVTSNEGQNALNSGTVSDADGDAVTLSASVGTVINNNDGTWSWSYIPTDGPANNQTVTITADDGKGGSASTSFTLAVNNIAPTINSVTNSGPLVNSGSATINVSASDPAGANDPLQYAFDCNNDNVFEVGPQVESSAACTFTSVGQYPVNVQVRDDDGGVSTGNTVVTVQYAWNGFLQPVDNLPVVNTVNAGQGIPAKFSLGGDYGLNIFASGYPASQNVSCGSSGGGSTSPIDQTVTAGNSTLQYDPTTQTYTYIWKTDKAWAGTCRTLIVKLIDGVQHTAFFQFNGKARSISGDESGEDGSGDEGATQGFSIFLPLVNR